MFRKPRTQSLSVIDIPLSPSTGRPPTPPSSTTGKATVTDSHTMPSLAAKVPLPLLGPSQTLPRSTNRQSAAVGKTKGKSNGSILSFFKKADSPKEPAEPLKSKEEDLFFQEDGWQNNQETTQTLTPPQDEGAFITSRRTHGADDFLRYNEYTGSVKRQRVSDQEWSLLPSEDEDGLPSSLGRKEVNTSLATMVASSNEVPVPPALHTTPKVAVSDVPSTSSADNVKAARDGPFIEDSESEDDLTKELSKAVFGITQSATVQGPSESVMEITLKCEPSGGNPEDLQIIPTLKREATSIIGGDGFDGIEDFIDDEFPEDGEEYMERRWMEEQRQIELGLDDDGDADDKVFGINGRDDSDLQDRSYDEAEANSCPICNVNFAGITAEVRICLLQHSSKWVLISLGGIYPRQSLLGWKSDTTISTGCFHQEGC